MGEIVRTIGGASYIAWDGKYESEELQLEHIIM